MCIALVCPSAREYEELDTRRDSSFFYSRNAGFQHYRGICLCGNGLFSILRGTTRLCGNGISLVSRHPGQWTRYFPFSWDTGYGISHFSRDHGLLSTIPQDLSRGKNPGEGSGILHDRYDEWAMNAVSFRHRHDAAPWIKSSSLTHHEGRVCVGVRESPLQVPLPGDLKTNKQKSSNNHATTKQQPRREKKRSELKTQTP